MEMRALERATGQRVLKPARKRVEVAVSSDTNQAEKRGQTKVCPTKRANTVKCFILELRHGAAGSSPSGLQNEMRAPNCSTRGLRLDVSDPNAALV